MEALHSSTLRKLRQLRARAKGVSKMADSSVAAAATAATTRFSAPLSSFDAPLFAHIRAFVDGATATVKCLENASRFVKAFLGENDNSIWTTDVIHLLALAAKGIPFNRWLEDDNVSDGEHSDGSDSEAGDDIGLALSDDQFYDEFILDHLRW
ncbi:UNVERIFIED_CONTAM: hypothetical protein HDU68_000529 [Siphonaria sp. JEL0065]|nr:hypothetical protein HDU68_000529 [Siphonaria sp. JEL0065]